MMKKIEILLGITKGMVELHSKGITHRDLAARNVLLQNENGKNLAKITDFGMSRKKLKIIIQW